MHLHGNAGLLPEYSVGNCSRDSSCLSTHGTLLLAMDLPSKADCSQTVHAGWVEIASLGNSCINDTHKC